MVYTGLIDVLTPPVRVSPTQGNALVASYWDRVVKINTYDSLGSGIMLTPSGLLLTNHHVLEHARGDVEFSNGSKSSIEDIVYSDEHHDLVLAQCSLSPGSKEKLTDKLPLHLGQDPLTFEDTLYVFGFKRKSIERRQGNFIGVFGQLYQAPDGSLVTNRATRKIHNVTNYSNALVEQGFSGGPVVRKRDGALVGLTWGMFADTEERAHDTRSDGHLFIGARGLKPFLDTCVTQSYDQPPHKSYIRRKASAFITYLTDLLRF